MPNLLEAPHAYWRKLDDVKAAYQRREISLEEVNWRIKNLVAELDQERRRTFSYIFNRLRQNSGSIE